MFGLRAQENRVWYKAMKGIAVQALYVLIMLGA